MNQHAQFLSGLLLLFILVIVSSCSSPAVPVKITQYTDPSYVTGIAKYNGHVYCTTKGGLVEWDAQTKEYQIFTTADGLVSNVLTDVIVDGENNLWVGSLEGLCMYDGKTWKILSTANGLPSLEINDLSVDRNGVLWVGTGDGAAKYENGRFNLLAEENSPGRVKINYIYFDRGNNLWICTDTDGIYFKKGDKWELSGHYNGLPQRGSSVITQAWDLGMWTGSELGIYLWAGHGWAAFSSYSVMQSVALRFIDSPDQRIWYFTSNGIHSSHGNDWFHLTEDDGLLSNDVTAGLIISDNELYIGTAEGLSIYEDGRIENYVVPNTPKGSNFISVDVDEKSRVWFGTWEEGVNLFESGHWITFTSDYDEELSTVRSTKFFPDGSIMFNTVEGLIAYKDRDWKKYTRRSGLPDNDVRCGLVDKTGKYWIGTASGISYRKNGTWKRFRTVHGLPSHDVWSCALDENGNVWFGTTAGIVSFEDDAIIDWTPETGFENIDVRSIATVDGVMYFGTENGEVLTYDGTSWDLIGNKYLKTEESIYAIAADAEGGVWFGTFGDGLIRLYNGEAVRYTWEDGMPSNYVRSLEFKNGVLWASCYGGIAKIEVLPAAE